MANEFEDHRPGLSSPAQHAFAITPDDDNDLANVPRGICFATVGTLKVTTLAGDTVTFPSGTLSPGIIHPLQVARVFDTGTSVTSVMGVY